MNIETISIIGLILSIAPFTLHGIETLYPMMSRWLANWVLPFFGLKKPSTSTALTYDEQITMLDAALEAAPEKKKLNAKDYIFVMLFEQRQGGIAFTAIAVGAVYAMTIPLADRYPIHLIYGVLAVLFAIVNANHAGVRFLGHHPKVSRNGRNVGFVLTPYWIIAAVLNFVAFSNI
jgi:alcohol dehydrogenase class IV